MSINDINSLSHTKWNCKYHIVFAPKYRRKVFYREKRVEIGKILRQLCEWRGVKIIEAEVCPDHIHMLVEIPPKISVSSFMGYLKGKSIISLMKVNIGLALVGVIIGEFLAARQGLGYLIIYGSQVFKLDLVIMSIVVLCIVAVCLYQLIQLLERHLSRSF